MSSQNILLDSWTHLKGQDQDRISCDAHCRCAISNETGHCWTSCREEVLQLSYIPAAIHSRTTTVVYCNKNNSLPLSWTPSQSCPPVSPQCVAYFPSKMFDYHKRCRTGDCPDRNNKGLWEECLFKIPSYGMMCRKCHAFNTQWDLLMITLLY